MKESTFLFIEEKHAERIGPFWYILYIILFDIYMYMYFNFNLLLTLRANQTKA